MIKIYNGTPKKDEIEMRKVYSSKLGELMGKHNEIVALEADLMNAITTDKVQKEYHERVINCGIMEANMIGIAAGMSIAGKYPFAHFFTAFSSRRCFDQLFMSGAYQKNNIKVIASDAGVTSAHNGGTHMSFEDMGIMRGLANTVVMEMTDATMFENILEQVATKDGFYWIRTIRKNAATIYEKGSTFEIGEGNLLKDGSDITLIANGIMVSEAIKASEKLEKEKKEKEEAEIFGRLFVKLRKNLVEVKSKLSQEASEDIDFLIGLIDESEISRTSYYYLYKEAQEIILKGKDGQ